MGPQRPPDFPAEAQDSEGGEEGQGGGGGDARYEVQGRTCRFIQGDLLERRAYERAGVASANAVILGSLQVGGAGPGGQPPLGGTAAGSGDGQRKAASAHTCPARPGLPPLLRSRRRTPKMQTLACSAAY